MTNSVPVEDRLRRTFQAVADQPVPVVTLDGDRPAGHRRSPSRHRTGLLVSAAVVVVAAIGTVAVVYGPRSSTPGSPPLTGTQNGGAVAVFRPTNPTATKGQLADDAKVLTRRLASLGDDAARAQVRGRTVVIVGGSRLPVPAAALLTSGTLDFRPLLCAAYPYVPPPPPPSGEASLGPQLIPHLTVACAATHYSLQAPNLVVNTASGTSNEASILLDPNFVTEPTSTPAYDESHPDEPVLVPLVGGGEERYLLGPSELSGSAIASAVAVHQGAVWVVDATFTARGAVGWDTLAHRYFHEIIGVDLDGQALSVPLTEPTQSAFTSFAGRVQIGGNFDEHLAQTLAAVLNSGPLGTPLTD